MLSIVKELEVLKTKVPELKNTIENVIKDLQQYVVKSQKLLKTIRETTPEEKVVSIKNRIVNLGKELETKITGKITHVDIEAEAAKLEGELVTKVKDTLAKFKTKL